MIDLTDIAAWKCELCHHWIGVRNNHPPTIMKVRHREAVPSLTNEIVAIGVDSTLVVCRGCLSDIENHDAVWNREGDKFHS